jgi:PadR family transcriptional regulator PadR
MQCVLREREYRVRDWVTQLRKGLLELCLLNLLRHGESYGYEIVQRLKRVEALSVTESTVYPILSRLRKDGCLSVRSEPSPGGPPRRYFSLTRIGKAYLTEMNAHWEDLVGAVRRLQRGEESDD